MMKKIACYVILRISIFKLNTLTINEMNFDWNFNLVRIAYKVSVTHCQNRVAYVYTYINVHEDILDPIGVAFSRWLFSERATSIGKSWEINALYASCIDWLWVILHSENSARIITWNEISDDVEKYCGINNCKFQYVHWTKRIRNQVMSKGLFCMAIFSRNLLCKLREKIFQSPIDWLILRF